MYVQELTRKKSIKILDHPSSYGPQNISDKALPTEFPNAMRRCDGDLRWLGVDTGPQGQWLTFDGQ